METLSLMLLVQTTCCHVHDNFPSLSMSSWVLIIKSDIGVCGAQRMRKMSKLFIILCGLTLTSSNYFGSNTKANDQCFCKVGFYVGMLIVEGLRFLWELENITSLFISMLTEINFYKKTNNSQLTIMAKDSIKTI